MGSKMKIIGHCNLVEPCYVNYLPFTVHLEANDCKASEYRVETPHTIKYWILTV